MLKKDAIKYFGSAAKMSRALKVSQPAISKWGDIVPELRAYQINDIKLQEKQKDETKQS